MSSDDDLLWWQSGIIYEVYVRSYQDTSGNGIGDINGIRQRLDYLNWLGIDILWLTPPYKSPQLEFGYDIADYVSIDPLFGTLDDFDSLISEAHALGMKIVLDIAPNHTSDQHEWFKESRTSRTNPKSDWYLWRDPAPDGRPPNNWVSAFGGKSAWEFVPERNQYYYHAFKVEQPDLNWRNPEVEKAFFDCLRFWLDRGIDGFRIDVMWHMVKDKYFRDNPPNPGYDPETMPSNNILHELYSANRPETIDLVTRMRNVLKEYDGDRLMIGELYQAGEELLNYYGTDGAAAQLPHNQQLILLPWEAVDIRNALEKYLGALPESCWPNWVLGNHDKPRIATRVKSQEQARVAMMMLLTLRGTPTMYYGDEIGMENVEIPPDKIQDPFEKLDPGKGQGRDPQRTPMQWDGHSNNAGFTTAIEPWLPMSGTWLHINVEAQKADQDSILNMTRALIELRRDNPAFVSGTHRLILTQTNGTIIAFRREHKAGNFIVALNVSALPVDFETPYGYEKTEPVLSTVPGKLPASADGCISLRANEGLILRQV